MHHHDQKERVSRTLTKAYADLAPLINVLRVYEPGRMRRLDNHCTILFCIVIRNNQCAMMQRAGP